MDQFVEKVKEKIGVSLIVAFFAGMLLLIILGHSRLADSIELWGINFPFPVIEVTREVFQTIEVTRVVEAAPENHCDTYGFKIISPIQGQIMSGEILVEGTYEVEPPKEEMLLYVVNRENNLFWPKSRDGFVIDPVNLRWKWRGDLGLSPGSEAFVGIAVIDLNGQTLTDYFEKAGQEFGGFPGIEKFTDDFHECYRVLIGG